MKKIKLTQGKYAIVDDADFEILNKNKWYAMKIRNTWYAARRYNGKHLYMHAVVFGASRPDHIDCDGLNNQKNNLRAVSISENAKNYTKRKGSSLFKGVTWNKNKKKWEAQKIVNGKHIYLGVFNEEKDAAEAVSR